MKKFDIDFPILDFDSGREVHLIGDSLVMSHPTDKPQYIGDFIEQQNGNIVLIKKGLKKSKHLFRKYNGYGTESFLVNALKDNYFIAFDVDGDRFYQTVANIKSHSVLVNYGHGNQFVIPVQHLRKV